MARESFSVPTLKDWAVKTTKENKGGAGLDPSVTQGRHIYLTGMEEGRVYGVLYQDGRRELFVNLKNRDATYPDKYFKLDEQQASRVRAGDEVKVMQTTILRHTEKNIEQEVIYSLQAADYPMPNRFKR